MLDRVEYGNKGITIDSIPISYSCYYTVSLEKAFFKQKNTDQYFIKIYRTDLSGLCSRENMGYIYFYLDKVSKTSSYIGTYVKPEYRSIGLASLLTAYWIKICLEEGYEFLTTNKTQRKPYLLYILKRCSFEIDNPEQYNLSKYTIHICKDNHNQRVLLFKSDKYARDFQNGKIYQGDDYKILLLEGLGSGIVLSNDETISSEKLQKLLEKAKNKVQLLDRVLLSNIYSLRDNETAYNLSTKRINEKEIIQSRSKR